MTAGELMNRQFETVHADARIEDVARKLERSGMNLLPVCREGYLVGTITQEEAALHLTAPGRRPGVRVGDVIAPDLLFCFENTDVAEAASLMIENRVNLLPVLGRGKMLVGVLALENIPGGRAPAARKAEEPV